MRARMWGGLLQDTVSPLGDMVHYLAKASFLQDMLLGMFVCFVILQKLAFCKICYSVCLFVFLYVIIGVQIVSSHNKPYTHITSLV